MARTAAGISARGDVRGFGTLPYRFQIYGSAGAGCYVLSDGRAWPRVFSPADSCAFASRHGSWIHDRQYPCYQARRFATDLFGTLSQHANACQLLVEYRERRCGEMPASGILRSLWSKDVASRAVRSIRGGVQQEFVHGQDRNTSATALGHGTAWFDSKCPGVDQARSTM